ncbi:hypothetical protein [Brevibacterium sp. K72]|uniref:hypothetical protein n=1 Tax=Brevibacterium sp. K72 TaxID=3390729 RepID=UPI003D30081B
MGKYVINRDGDKLELRSQGDGSILVSLISRTRGAWLNSLSVPLSELKRIVDRVAKDNPRLLLDQHPEAVPSPPAELTITRSALRQIIEETKFGDMGAVRPILFATRLGFTVVADPVPTEAERIESALDLYDLDDIGNEGRARFAAQLAADGFRAPGGEGRG